jgi:hypothetical protein
MTLARVLLGDDETPFIQALSKRLSKRDLLVMTATSGPAALDKLKTESPPDCFRNAGVEGSNPFISTWDFINLGRGQTSFLLA